MITCPKCETENSSEAQKCSQCGKKLLPGKGLGERLGSLGCAAILLVIFVAMLSSTKIFWIPFFIIGPLLLAAIGYAFSKTPLHGRYMSRAQQYIESNPEQALADFSKTLELSQGRVLQVYRERAKLFIKLDRKREAVSDLEKWLANPAKGRGAFGAGYMSEEKNKCARKWRNCEKS